MTSVVFVLLTSTINLDFSSIRPVDKRTITMSRSACTNCGYQYLGVSTVTENIPTQPLVVVIEPNDFACSYCDILKAHLRTSGIKFKTKISSKGPYPRIEYKGRTLVGFDREAVDKLVGIKLPQVVIEVPEIVSSRMMDSGHMSMGSHHSMRMKVKQKGRGPIRSIVAALFGSGMKSSHHMSYRRPMSMGFS